MNEYESTMGNIHTATYFIEGEYKSASATGRAISKFRPTTRKGREGTLIQFNPNELYGYCDSISRYKAVLQKCAIALGFTSDPDLQRLDFKVDYTTSQEGSYATWLKICEWAVTCFGIKKKAKQKNEGRTDSFLSVGHAKTFAGTKGWALVCYNKSTQKPAEGVGYRFEIQRMDIKGKSERAVLQEMHELMLALPRYAERALQTRNERLLALWNGTCPDKAERRNANEFIRAHMRDIYTFEQLKAFYELLGYKKKSAAKAAYNFKNRHASTLVLLKQQELTEFCKMVACLIERYAKEHSAQAA